MEKKGQDRWGKFYDLSGHEEIGKCFWCGKDVSGKRYCCEQHKWLYLETFIWMYASAACIRRAGGKCEICQESPGPYDWQKGYEYELDHRLEVHHIDPILGEDRTMNKKNRPDNLKCLCHKCHKEANRADPRIQEKRNRSAKATAYKKHKELKLHSERNQLSLFKEE